MTHNVSRFAQCSRPLLTLVFYTLLITVLPAAELKILFPQARDVFQTNEVIDVSVVRTSPQALAAGDLQLALAGEDGSKLSFTFPTVAAQLAGDAARRTEHLHLNGWLLRPGKYTVSATADGATASAPIEVHSHVRKSDYVLINWGKAKGDGQLLQGEDSFGYNMQYMAAGPQENGNYIRAGVDYMNVCTMSGGHQMDLRLECDWSDPYVTRGGTQRVVRRAFQDRLYPNALGVHFYDEPGLTWSEDPETKEFGPHSVVPQAKSYLAAFGRAPLKYNKVDPNNPDHVAQWEQWGRWKLGFMDAAWAESQFGVSRVSPRLLSVTQSQYGFSAYTDGYYFNVVRSLPVISGHGGYHDYGLNYFNPSYFLEMARSRDYARPNWYLPTWYGNTTPDQMRLEQYLSFQTNIQGMMTAPDEEPADNAIPRQGIVESNLLMQKLGPIFNTIPVTKPPVAMLVSLSNFLRVQAHDRKQAYLHDTQQGKDTNFTYLAGKMLQQQFLPVIDEDVLDGSLAADHKAVIVTSVEYLEPQVVAKLEEFIAAGGLVLLAGDCKQTIKGAVDLGVKKLGLPDQAKVDELNASQKYSETTPYRTMGKFYEAAKPLATAIKAQLDKAGIKPVFECNLPSITATRQAAGDVEYLFAVNATYDSDYRDEKGNVDPNALKAAKAALAVVDDGRPVYDALVGGPVPELKAAGGKLAGEFRFGPGEMRVLARTARPIGVVRVATPNVVRDLALDRQPVRLELAAIVLDNNNRVLSGSIPVQVTVIDPLGAPRYELYRSTKQGQFNIALPLAANDPPGKWTVVVREMLSGQEDRVPFEYTSTRSRTLAGSTGRAVAFPDDIERAFQFGRTFNEVTIVTGSSPFNEAAAARLASILEPWGIKSKRMPLAEAAKSRPISEAEATTWTGLDFAGKGQIKPGDGNTPNLSGFAVQGPVVLIGNPEDHAIIKFLADAKFLAYAPAANVFPGVGRGYIAWQRDGVGKGQESITLIAHDEAGMNEAVGSLYEAIAGIKPLMRWEAPVADAFAPASSAIRPQAATIAWEARVPDRVLALQAAGDGLVALSHDGSATTLSAAGKIAGAAEADAGAIAAARKPQPAIAPDAAKPFARKDRMTKLIVPAGERVAVAYWGGTLRVADPAGKVLTEQLLPQDITALTWSGNKIIAGLADGRVLALETK